MAYSNKFRLTIVASILIVALSCMAVVIGLSYAPTPAGNNITMVLGFSSTIVVSLFTLLRAEKTADTLQETKQEIRETKVDVASTKVELHKHTEEVRQLFLADSEIVRIAVEAERDQLLNSVALPKTDEELRKLINEIIETSCSKLIVEIKQEVASLRKDLL